MREPCNQNWHYRLNLSVTIVSDWLQQPSPVCLLLSPPWSSRRWTTRSHLAQQSWLSGWLIVLSGRVWSPGQTLQSGEELQHRSVKSGSPESVTSVTWGGTQLGGWSSLDDCGRRGRKRLRDGVIVTVQHVRRRGDRLGGVNPPNSAFTHGGVKENVSSWLRVGAALLTQTLII